MDVVGSIAGNSSLPVHGFLFGFFFLF
eukprot:SAG31_NODE_32726_length_352_cov_0.909091_1_plen_26_part_01